MIEECRILTNEFIDATWPAMSFDISKIKHRPFPECFEMVQVDGSWYRLTKDGPDLTKPLIVIENIDTFNDMTLDIMTMIEAQKKGAALSSSPKLCSEEPSS